MTLIYLSSAWVLGVLLGSVISLTPLLAIGGLVPFFFLLRFPRQSKVLILSGLCIIFLFAGSFRFSNDIATNVSVASFNGSGTVQIKGTIFAEPDVRDKVTHLRLSADSIKTTAEWQSVSGDVLLYVPRYPAYKYGDMLLVSGKPETPPQLGDFDYQVYLAHQGIYSTIYNPRIDVLEEGKGVLPMMWLYSFREHLSQVLGVVLPEPQSSLAQGIILGIRSTISPSFKADLSRTGTAHLLAISGLNLSIIAGILIAFFLWLFGHRHYIYVWLTLLLIWLYSILTGLEAPVVRSAIMASLFLFAELLGRQRSAITALAFAAAVMIGISPQVLWSASFQMSFLAMAGLIFVAPLLRNLGRNAIYAGIGEEGIVVRLARLTSDSLAVTLGAIIAVLPVIAYYFGIVSFIGPFATLLVAPALPGIIVTGALAAFIGLISLPVAYILGWFAWLFLSYMLLMVSGFAAIPLASADVGSVDARLVWAYYLVIAIIVWLAGNKKKLAVLASQTASHLKPAASHIAGLKMRFVLPPLVMLAILTPLGAASMPDDNLHVSVLDVGEGDAILVQRGSQQVLIDGGPSPQAVCLGLGSKMPFWDRTIELVVLTHPHADHLTGLVEVMNRYRVEQVLMAETFSTSPLYSEWLRVVRDSKIKAATALYGQLIDLGGGAVINVLNQFAVPVAGEESDVDNTSVVLRLRQGTVSFLFTADVRKQAEIDLIGKRAGLSCAVLKVAHHGLDTASSSDFLAAVNPKVAVISVGADNRFGHPGEEALSRLAGKLGETNIYRTDRNGTVEFITDGNRLWVKTEKGT